MGVFINMKVLLQHKNIVIEVISEQEIISQITYFFKPYLEVIKERKFYINWTITTICENFRGFDKIFCSKLHNDVYISYSAKCLIINQRNALFFSFDIIRVIRAIFRWCVWSENGCFLHGGFLSVCNKGILICGKRKSGKTSLIMSLLSQQNVCYGTNDDLSVDWNEGKLRAYGWGTSIGVRLDTYTEIRNISSRFLESEIPIHPNNIDAASREKRIYYTHIQLTEKYNNPIINGKLIDYIFFTSFLGYKGEKTEIRRLYSKDAQMHLFENLQDNPDIYDDLQDYVDAPNKRTVAKMIPELAQSIPCFYLQQYFNTLDSSVKLIMNICTSNELSIY